MVEAGDYAEVFQAAFADRLVRRRELPGAQLHIFGQLEARLTETDRVILGGLVETMWPPAPRVDPWLSRPMRHELGLDLPERRIGLSAHDFAQMLGHRTSSSATPPRSAARRRSRRVSCTGWKRSRARSAGRRPRAPATDMSTMPARSISPPRSSRWSSQSPSRRAKPARQNCPSPRSRTGCAIPTRSMPGNSQAGPAGSRGHAAVGGRSRLRDS